MKVITIVALIALAVSGLVYAIFQGIHYSTGSGEHTGFITAVERNGIIWKTGRAYVKTDLSSSQEDIYCVTDPAVYDKLVELAKSKAPVTVEYVTWLVAGITNCGGEPAVITGTK